MRKPHPWGASGGITQASEQCGEKQHSYTITTFSNMTIHAFTYIIQSHTFFLRPHRSLTFRLLFKATLRPRISTQPGGRLFDLRREPRFNEYCNRNAYLASYLLECFRLLPAGLWIPEVPSEEEPRTFCTVLKQML